MSAQRHTVFFELRDALGEPGCAICALVLRRLRRYMELLTYERVNDVTVRAELREARGFCPAHGQLLREARSALGTAIIHHDLLRALRGALEAPDPPRGVLGRMRGGGARRGLAPARACPACAQRQEAEQLYLEALLRYLGDPELLAAFTQSAGLCRIHLGQGLARASAAAAGQLRAAQLAIWQRLIDELDSFIRKHDYAFADEPIGAEGDAWARASLLVSGLPQLGHRHEE